MSLVPTGLVPMERKTGSWTALLRACEFIRQMHSILTYTAFVTYYTARDCNLSRRRLRLQTCIFSQALSSFRSWDQYRLLPFAVPSETETWSKEKSQARALVEKLVELFDRPTIDDHILNEYGSNPMLLTIFSLLPHVSEPASRSGLILQAIDFLLGSSGWNANEVVKHRCYWALKRIAWKLFRLHSSQDTFSFSDWTNAGFDHEDHDIGMFQEHLFTKILTRSGRNDLGEPTFSFMHGSFFEYLVASGIANEATKFSWNSFIGEWLETPDRWLGIVPFLAEQLFPDDLRGLARELIAAAPHEWTSTWTKLLQSLLLTENRRTFARAERTRNHEGDRKFGERILQVTKSPDVHRHPQALLSQCYAELLSEGDTLRTHRETLVERSQDRFWLQLQDPIPLQADSRSAPLHDDAVEQLVFSRGKLISRGRDGTVAMWVPDSGDIDTLPQTVGPISVFAVLAGGGIAIGGEDGSVRVCSFPLAKDNAKFLYREKTQVTALLQLDTTNELLVGHLDGKLLRIGLTGSKPILVGRHRGAIRHLLQLPSAEFLSAGDDGAIRKWSLKHNTTTAEYPGYYGAVRALELSPDETRFVSGHESGRVIEGYFNNNTTCELAHLHSPITQIVVPNSTEVIVGTEGGYVLLVGKYNTTTTVKLLDRHDSSVVGIASDILFRVSLDYKGNLFFAPYTYNEKLKRESEGEKETIDCDTQEVKSQSHGRLVLFAHRAFPDSPKFAIGDSNGKVTVRKKPTNREKTYIPAQFGEVIEIVHFPSPAIKVSVCRTGLVHFTGSSSRSLKNKDQIGLVHFSGSLSSSLTNKDQASTVSTHDNYLYLGTDTGKIVVIKAYGTEDNREIGVKETDTGKIVVIKAYGKPVQVVSVLHGKMTAIAVDPEGNTLLCGDDTGHLLLLNRTGDGRLHFRSGNSFFKDPLRVSNPSPVVSIYPYKKEGVLKGFLIGVADGRVCFLSMERGKLDDFRVIPQLDSGTDEKAHCAHAVCFARIDDSTVIVSLSEGNVGHVNPVKATVTKLKLVKEKPTPFPIRCITGLGLNRRFGSGHEDGSVRLWTQEGDEWRQKQLDGKHLRTVTALKLKGELLASSGADGSIFVRKKPDFFERTVFCAPDMVTALSWTDDRTLAIGLNNGTFFSLTVKCPAGTKS